MRCDYMRYWPADGSARCHKEACWRGDPNKLLLGAQGFVWCEEHHHKDDLPLAAALRRAR